MLERARDRLQRSVWHALNRYDDLKRRVRENQAGRSAVGFVVLLLLAAGATLGFVAANAAARDDVSELTPERASNAGVVYTVTQSIVSRQTVRLAAKHSPRRPGKTVTVTKRSPRPPARTVALSSTRTVTHTVSKLRTVTVTQVQPTTVVVTVTEDEKHGKP